MNKINELKQIAKELERISGEQLCNAIFQTPEEETKEYFEQCKKNIYDFMLFGAKRWNLSVELFERLLQTVWTDHDET